MNASRTHIRYSRGDRAVLCINFIFLTLFMIVILYPLLYVVAASVTGGSATPPLWLIPDHITFASYEALLGYGELWTGFANSFLYMILGTVIALLVTVCCAYPLSVPDFKGSRLLMPMCMITMYFSGGLVPTYLVMKELHLINTVWAVTLPGAMSISNMIVMRTYFRSQIPSELRESAELDGCGNIRYLVSIVLPLSGAILAVIGMYYAVGIWNAYFDAMIYLKKRNLYPLTLFIREILITNSSTAMDQMTADLSMGAELEARRNLMKYAVIIVSTLPMMVIYPFVQKYFVKGVMIGAIKG